MSWVSLKVDARLVLLAFSASLIVVVEFLYELSCYSPIMKFFCRNK